MKQKVNVVKKKIIATADTAEDAIKKLLDLLSKEIN